ncbi:MAG: ligase-associated DNA damage response DEXH box helicase [Bdellovibrionales bacterium]|nr:ligase-associated DNA damage response DEXH box helicase [Bdellovibrionales bacterium]
MTPEQWFSKQGWRPFDYQRAAWDAFDSGASGLIHARTGSGKTYAALLGLLRRAIVDGERAEGLRLLWITPLRALAFELEVSIRRAVADLLPAWRVERRTSDTSASARSRQLLDPPEILITTPESASLLLSYEQMGKSLKSLDLVVVDEWHELVGTKRGVQTELVLVSLRSSAPGLQTWGLSATIGNLAEAQEVLCGSGSVLIEGPSSVSPDVDTLLPPAPARFPWAGHMGLQMLEEVISVVERCRSTLLFTNTRNQAEVWHQALQGCTTWGDSLGLHHGSLDRALREDVETRARLGLMRCIVATSSLELGVDFPVVDQVVQVGSPKGIARLLQRAGRSNHAPGRRSRLVFVPTNTFELVEFEAAKRLLREHSVESRKPLTLCLDVLAQHLVTLASGGGFSATATLATVRSTYCFRALSDMQWQWVLHFLTTGGETLRAYTQFHRLEASESRYTIASPALAKRHRMNIGTIVSDGHVIVRFLKGKRLGTVEESFIARLRPGDTFLFAGRTLTLVQLRDMVAIVRRGSRRTHTTAKWLGGRMPLSTHLAQGVRDTLTLAATGGRLGPEGNAACAMLSLQQERSLVPKGGELLLEQVTLRDGTHYFLYPFEGRSAHEGLAALLAYRLSRSEPRTISTVVNDYGLELLVDEPLSNPKTAFLTALDTGSLLEDLLAAIDAGELARRHFREIARIAGLVFQGFPGRIKETRQLQASSGLLYDVFSRHDPENLLLQQAAREVVEQQLEFSRLGDALARISAQQLRLHELPTLSPFSFPLWAARMQAEVSTERWQERVKKMSARLEADSKRGLTRKRSGAAV